MNPLPPAKDPPSSAPTAGLGLRSEPLPTPGRASSTASLSEGLRPPSSAYSALDVLAGSAVGPASPTPSLQLSAPSPWRASRASLLDAALDIYSHEEDGPDGPEDPPPDHSPPGTHPSPSLPAHSSGYTPDPQRVWWCQQQRQQSPPASESDAQHTDDTDDDRDPAEGEDDASGPSGLHPMLPMHMHVLDDPFGMAPLPSLRAGATPGPPLPVSPSEQPSPDATSSAHNPALPASHHDQSHNPFPDSHPRTALTPGNSPLPPPSALVLPPEHVEELTDQEEQDPSLSAGSAGKHYNSYGLPSPRHDLSGPGSSPTGHSFSGGGGVGSGGAGGSVSGNVSSSGGYFSTLHATTSRPPSSSNITSPGENRTEGRMAALRSELDDAENKLAAARASNAPDAVAALSEKAAGLRRALVAHHSAAMSRQLARLPTESSPPRQAGTGDWTEPNHAQVSPPAPPPPWSVASTVLTNEQEEHEPESTLVGSEAAFQRSWGRQKEPRSHPATEADSNRGGSARENKDDALLAAAAAAALAPHSSGGTQGASTVPEGISFAAAMRIIALRAGSMESELDAARRAAAEHADLLARRRAEQDELERKVAEWQAKHQDQVEASDLAVAKHREALQNALSEHKAAADRWKQQARDDEAQWENALAQAQARAEEHAAHLTRQLDEKVQAHKALQAQHDTVLHEREQWETKHADLSRTHEAITKDHTALRDQHDGLNTTHEDLRLRHAELEGKHHHLRDDYSDLVQTHALLESEHTTLQAAHESLSARRDELADNVHRVERQLERAEQACKDLTSELAQMRHTHDDLAQRTSGLQVERESLVTTKSKLEEELSSAQEALRVKDERLSQLSEQLNEQLSQQPKEQPRELPTASSFSPPALTQRAVDLPLAAQQDAPGTGAGANGQEAALAEAVSRAEKAERAEAETQSALRLAVEQAEAQLATLATRLEAAVQRAAQAEQSTSVPMTAALSAVGAGAGAGAVTGAQVPQEARGTWQAPEPVPAQRALSVDQVQDARSLPAPIASVPQGAAHDPVQSGGVMPTDTPQDQVRAAQAEAESAKAEAQRLRDTLFAQGNAANIKFTQFMTQARHRRARSSSNAPTALHTSEDEQARETRSLPSRLVNRPPHPHLGPDTPEKQNQRYSCARRSSWPGLQSLPLDHMPKVAQVSQATQTTQTAPTGIAEVGILRVQMAELQSDLAQAQEQLAQQNGVSVSTSSDDWHVVSPLSNSGGGKETEPTGSPYPMGASETTTSRDLPASTGPSSVTEPSEGSKDANEGWHASQLQAELAQSKLEELRRAHRALLDKHHAVRAEAIEATTALAAARAAEQETQQALEAAREQATAGVDKLHHLAEVEVALRAAQRKANEAMEDMSIASAQHETTRTELQNKLAEVEAQMKEAEKQNSELRAFKMHADSISEFQRKERDQAFTRAEAAERGLRQLELAVEAERRIMAEREDLFTAFERRLESAEARLGEEDRRCAQVLGKVDGREEMDNLLLRIKGVVAPRERETAGQNIDSLISSISEHITDTFDELERRGGRIHRQPAETRAMITEHGEDGAEAPLGGWPERAMNGTSSGEADSPDHEAAMTERWKEVLATLSRYEQELSEQTKVAEDAVKNLKAVEADRAALEESKGHLRQVIDKTREETQAQAVRVTLLEEQLVKAQAALESAEEGKAVATGDVTSQELHAKLRGLQRTVSTLEQELAASRTHVAELETRLVSALRARKVGSMSSSMQDEHLELPGLAGRLDTAERAALEAQHAKAELTAETGVLRTEVERLSAERTRLLSQLKAASPRQTLEVSAPSPSPATSQAPTATADRSISSHPVMAAADPSVDRDTEPVEMLSPMPIALPEPGTPTDGPPSDYADARGYSMGDGEVSLRTLSPISPSSPWHTTRHASSEEDSGHLTKLATVREEHAQLQVQFNGLQEQYERLRTEHGQMAREAASMRVELESAKTASLANGRRHRPSPSSITAPDGSDVLELASLFPYAVSDTPSAPTSASSTNTQDPQPLPKPPFVAETWPSPTSRSRSPGITLSTTSSNSGKVDVSSLRSRFEQHSTGPSTPNPVRRGSTTPQSTPGHLHMPLPMPHGPINRAGSTPPTMTTTSSTNKHSALDWARVVTDVKEMRVTISNLRSQVVSAQQEKARLETFLTGMRGLLDKSLEAVSTNSTPAHTDIGLPSARERGELDEFEERDHGSDLVSPLSSSWATARNPAGTSRHTTSPRAATSAQIPSFSQSRATSRADRRRSGGRKSLKLQSVLPASRIFDVPSSESEVIPPVPAFPTALGSQRRTPSISRPSSQASARSQSQGHANKPSSLRTMTLGMDGKQLSLRVRDLDDTVVSLEAEKRQAQSQIRALQKALDDVHHDQHKSDISGLKIAGTELFEPLSSRQNSGPNSLMGADEAESLPPNPDSSETATPTASHTEHIASPPEPEGKLALSLESGPDRASIE